VAAAAAAVLEEAPAGLAAAAPEEEAQEERLAQRPAPPHALAAVAFLAATALALVLDVALRPCGCAKDVAGYSWCGAWQDVRCLLSCLQGGLLCHLLSVYRGGGAPGAGGGGPGAGALAGKVGMAIGLLPFW